MSAESALVRARELAGESVSVVNVVHHATKEGSVIVFEWTAMIELFDEPWPVPAASVCYLDSSGDLLSRKDFGSWLKNDR